MAIIRNGSNLPKTFKETIEIMQTESQSVSGLEDWGKGYRRGIRFGIEMLRKLHKGLALATEREQLNEKA